METLRRLREYVAQGYVFHGSRLRLEVIEPRQARDSENRLTGIQLAVYASTDILAPLARALMHPPPGRSGVSGYSIIGARMVLSGVFQFGPGYIHVLPPDSFEWFEASGERELVSRVAVRPVAVIHVEPDILDHLGVKIRIEA